LRSSSYLFVAVAVAVASLAVSAAGLAGPREQREKDVAPATEAGDGGGAKGAAAVPPGLAGDWFWGTVSPTQYRDRDTGEILGRGYSGALSYVFREDGTYQRHFYLEQRLGDSTSSIFSASEGTVTFTKDTFTLKPAKGTYRFVDGPRKKPRERPMRQDELERPGLVFTWRLEERREESEQAAEGGDADAGAGGEREADGDAERDAPEQQDDAARSDVVLVIGKGGEEPREFSRSPD
jgi:hypothetical protein